jgi:probable addiction module antidote protein
MDSVEVAMSRKKMPKGFAPYDPAESLTSAEDIAAYLEEALELGADDPGFLADALGVVARARNMSQLAKDTGISREGLYKALSRKGNPSLSTLLKVAKAFGVRLKVAPVAKRAA